MATDRYTEAYVYIDGRLLAEEASLTISRATNSQAVNTVAKGYGGESPGAASIEISVESAVPSADFDLNPGSFMQTLKPVELTVFAAGKTLTSKGFIISDSFTHGVNTAASISFQFRGSFQDWK